MPFPGDPSSSTRPTTRIPYAAPSTPNKKTTSMPLIYNTNNLEHPESPTRPSHRLPSLSPGREKISLSNRDKLSLSPDRSKRWRKPLFWRRAKRSIAILILLGLAYTLFLKVKRGQGRTAQEEGGAKKYGKNVIAVWRDKDAEDICRFVSPVEAYLKDLEGLKRLYPHDLPTNWLSMLEDREGKDEIDTVRNTTIQSHYFSPTGHLVYSDDRTDSSSSTSTSTAHPIPLLLELGEKRWENLLARQSKTLKEATQEYIRRYKRNPPKGFDIWWDFATTNDLVLPDEYDRINLDLAPFFALPKEEMKRRMELVEQMPETFTVVVEDGRVRVEIQDEGGLQWDGTLPRSRDIASLLEVFARFLPNIRATFSIFDQPQIYLSWARRESLVNLGLAGEHTKHLLETDSAHVRLSRSCHPNSNLRQNESYYEGRSFIYDNLESSNICQNPYVVPIHGLTIEPHGHDSHPKPHTQLLPLFSLAKTSINSDILITPLDQFHDPPGKDPKWEDKTNPKLAWRGSTTGISMMNQNLDWRSAHRIRLHHHANSPLDQEIDVLKPVFSDRKEWNAVNEPKEHLGVETERHSARDLADFYYDMKLAGGPLQCSDEDGTCHDMRSEIDFAPWQTAEQLNQHKFLLDIDGNGWSGRFRRLMSTNSMVIKTSLFTEWYQPHLIPWFMYVPAKLDFSDLADILAFFRGTPDHPDLAFDQTAKALARNGQCFAKRMFRMQDLQAYMMRLFLEYARLAADEGIDMDFHLDELSAEEDIPYAEERDPIELAIEDLEDDEMSHEQALNGPLEEVWVIEELLPETEHETGGGPYGVNDYRGEDDTQVAWIAPMEPQARWVEMGPGETGWAVDVGNDDFR